MEQTGTSFIDIETIVAKSANYQVGYFRYQLESLIDRLVSRIRLDLRESDLFGADNSTIEDMSKVVENIRRAKPGSQRQLTVLLGLDESGMSRAAANLPLVKDRIGTDIYRLQQIRKKIERDKNEINEIVQVLHELRERIDRDDLTGEIDEKRDMIEGYGLSLDANLVNIMEREKLCKLLLQTL